MKTRKTIYREYIIPMVARLAELHKGCPVLSVDCLGGGMHSIVYEIAFDDYERWIVKVYKTHGLNAAEAKWLELAAPVYTVPQVKFCHGESDDYPFDALGMSYMQGKTLANAVTFFTTRKKSKQLAEQAVSALLRLQEVKSQKFGAIAEQFYTDWETFYGGWTEEVVRLAEKKVQDGILDRRIYKLAETGALKMPFIMKDTTAQPVLVHGDLSVKNIIVKDGKVSAVIGPHESFFGDPEYDMFRLDKYAGKKIGLLQEYKKSAALSEHAEMKCALYALIAEIKGSLETGLYDQKQLSKLAAVLEKQYKHFGLR